MSEQIIKLEQEFDKIGQTLTESVANDKYSSNYYHTLRLNGTLNSIDKDNLKANVTLQCILISRYIEWSADDITFSVGVDDETKSSKTVTSGGNSQSSSTSKTYVTWTGDIPYNSDGTLTATLFAKSTGKGSAYAPPNQTAEIVATFPFIPRESSIKSINGEYLGSAVTVEIDRKNDAFVHKVEYSFAGSDYATVTSNGGTSVLFTPPLSLANNIPNDISGILTVRVTTLNGSTAIGNPVTKSITLKLPDSVLPTFTSITATPLSDVVPSSWGLFVRTLSKAVLNINGASGIYGSTIKSYLISGGGFSGSISSLTTGLLNEAGTFIFTATITDSRGRTASKTVSITVVDYQKPSISVTAQRCLSDGTISTSGTYLKVTAAFSYASVSGKNTISRNVSCNGASNNAFDSNSAFVFDCGVVATSSYMLTASISDYLGGSDSVEVKIDSDTALCVISEQKDSIVFGSYELEDGKFKVDMPMKVDNELDMNGNAIKNANIVDLIYPIGSIYMSVNSTSPATLFGGTWERIKDTFLLASGDTYTNGAKGGASKVSLTEANLPSHKHGVGTLKADETALTGRTTFRDVNTTDSNLILSANGVFAYSKSSWSGSHWAMNGSSSSGYYYQHLDIDATHEHTMSGDTDSTGYGAAFDTMPPYLAVYMWKRTA